MKVDKDAVVWLTPAELAAMLGFDLLSAVGFVNQVRGYNRKQRREVERAIGSKYALWPD